MAYTYGGQTYGPPPYATQGSPSPLASFGGAQMPQNYGPYPGSYSYSPGGGGATSPWNSATFFNDPFTQPIMQAWTTRMNNLQQRGPGYGDVEGMLRGYLQPDPRFNEAFGLMMNTAKGPAPTNAYTPEYAAAVRKRYQQLNAEPFTTSDEAALKARFYDKMALDRDAAYDQVRAEMAARGYAPTSGVAAALNEQVGSDYQKAHAAATQDLLEYTAGEAQRRKDLGVTIKGQLAQQGGADAQLAVQWNAARANILANAAQALATMRGQGLSAAEGIAGLRRQSYLDDQNRLDALLQTSALPSALEQQRMQMMFSSMGGDPMSQLLQLYQQQANQDQIRSGNRGAFYGAAGNIGGTILDNYLRHIWG